MIEEIIKSNEKDNQIKSILMDQIANLCNSVNSILSMSCLNVSSDIIQDTSNFIFYLCSYKGFFGTTPGENYSGIFKVNTGLKYIILNVLSYTLLKLCIKYIEGIKILQKHEDFRRYVLEKYLNVEYLTSTLEELGYIVLFLTGNRSNILQLALNVHYSTRKQIGEGRIISIDGYRALGLMLAVKSLINIGKTLIDIKAKYCNSAYDSMKRQLKLRHKSDNVKSIKEDKTISKNRQSDKTCLLCLDIRSNTSSTLCGHLFCWNCIVEYLQLNPKCPVCRSKCLVENVIHLANYE